MTTSRVKRYFNKLKKSSPKGSFLSTTFLKHQIILKERGISAIMNPFFNFIQIKFLININIYLKKKQKKLKEPVLNLDFDKHVSLIVCCLKKLCE